MAQIQPTLGLSLIAKDEEESLPNLLVSIEGAFDQVAFLDTGSTDRTIEIFEEWAEAEKERQPEFVSTIGHFEWVDDFAAARNAADELLDTEWLCWADCDDVIVDAANLRRVAASLAPQITIAAFPYEYFPDGPGVLIYPRLARTGKVIWEGRVHEGWTLLGGGVRGDFTQDDDRLPRWKHHPRDFESHRIRNFRILHRWVDEEPDQPEPLALLVAESLYVLDRDGMIDHATSLVERFGETWSSAQRETARWAIEGLRLRVDEAYPTQVEGMKAFLPLITSPLGSLASQSLGDTRRGIGLVQPRAVPPATRKTRQQRRAEARRQAKDLVRRDAR